MRIDAAIVLMLGTLPCEVTVEAEHGNLEAVAVCTLLDHRPVWLAWSPVARVVRHHTHLAGQVVGNRLDR